MTIRPRRSVLYMPGSNVRAIDKARTLPVDTVILDLEDSIAPDAKDAARAHAEAAITARGFGHREVVLRVNPIGSPWWIEDINAAARAQPDAILLPKVSSLDQLTLTANRLMDISADHRIRLWIMVETPMGILNIHQIVAAAAGDVELRLAGLVLGTNDIARETHSRIVPGRAPMMPWLTQCILVAHAYGQAILDGVYNDLTDAIGFVQECVQARDMGFDGKTLIHPSQIEACNAAFTPSAEEVAEARKILTAFDRPENRDKGVIALDGKMVERLHAEMAQRTIAIADAIAGR